uniref:EB domain-containing protein n=1 Tax=Wuchereria bancrofti TaxID=6293 RepID=A0A1I8F1E0_WUCBA
MFVNVQILYNVEKTPIAITEVVFAFAESCSYLCIISPKSFTLLPYPMNGHQYWNQSCIPTFSRTLISPIKTCKISADCTAGAKCIANRCHCPAGEIFTEGRCQMVFAEPGESCFNGETCISNYVCINGSCLCPDGEVSKDGNCITEDTEIKKYTSYQGKFPLPFNSSSPRSTVVLLFFLGLCT